MYRTHPLLPGHWTLLYHVFCFFLLASCATNRSAVHILEEYEEPVGSPIQSICFFGNADRAKALPAGATEVLLRDIFSTSASNMLLILGNNAVQLSLQDSSSIKTNRTAIQSLDRSFRLVKNLKAAVYALPGAGQWDNGGRNGEQMARLMEFHVERTLGYGDIVKPDYGCPGPEEVYLDRSTVLLLINTQWWLHDWDKPNQEDGCQVSGDADFLLAVDDAIKRNYDKKIIVAGHHALQSSGRRGGHFPLKTHAFPFTELSDNLYIPLPGLGSLYVLYRKLLGNNQDQSSPRYRMMKRNLKQIFKQHNNLIYLSGSELSMEYQQTDSIHLVNAGSISMAKSLTAHQGKFAVSEQGFGVLRLYSDGSVWLEFYALQGNNQRLIYRRKLFASKTAKQQQWIETATRPDYSDSVKTARVTGSLQKGRKAPGMMGNNYRAEWGTPIKGVPYFDLQRELGGLTIVKRGGGMQTRSLRLEDSLGREYVLRSVEKFPSNALPDDLRGTIAENVIKEQISASHPYAALAIPRLADAAGVYHTNPKLVWLPDDPELGIYREIYGNGLYLFEERPNEPHKRVKSFGYSDKIISTPSILENLLEHSSRYVDENHVVRSRLFDILIGDWDRHDDQWRWAMFEDSTERKFYRPIPRDRDQAFFWSDGWLLKVATRRWGMPKFQGFHHEIRDVAGMNFNARYFDRSFMTEATLDDWLREARYLQERITARHIEQSVKDLPPEIYALHGDEIISKLKARKKDLQTYAREMYLFLAKEVDVLGSEDRDLFEVDRGRSGSTRVTIHRIKGSNGELKYKTYDRSFSASETREIRLFGFDGDDIFVVRGDADKSILVRIVGGAGKDVITDQSHVEGLKKHTVVYDRARGTTLSASSETKDKTSDQNPGVNAYNRKAFQYDVAMPLITARYNPDDKIFIGAGVVVTTHGFRKDPFKARHTVMADIAPYSQSYSFSYKGQFTDVAGRWDFILNASISAPSFSDYFYGYGNATVFDKERQERDPGYYRVRYKHYIFHPEFEWKSKNDYHAVLVGGGYQSINIGSELNESGIEQQRFIIQYANSQPYALLDKHRHYLGLYANYVFDNTNNALQPTNGFRYQLGALSIKDADQVSLPVAFTKLTSSLSFYYTFGRTLKSTLAVRAGGIANFGDYEFYHAARIGGNTRFRGVRRMRLAGQQAFYQNTELRVKLFQFSSPIIPGDFGLTFFHDVGKIWYPDDPSAAEGDIHTWHRAYGAGIWLAPLSKAALGLDYSISTLDERAFYLRLGFFF